MKKLLLPLLLVSGLSVNAQTTYLSEFYLEDEQVSDKYVIEDAKTKT